MIHTGGLSEVCRAVPALVNMRRANPGARIDWAVREKCLPVIASHPDLNRAVPLPLAAGGGWWRSRSIARDWRASMREHDVDRYDTAIDLKGDGLGGVIARTCGATRRVCNRSASAGARLRCNVRHVVPADLVHEVDLALSLIAAEGASGVADTRLYVAQDHQTWWTRRRRELGLIEGSYAILAPTTTRLSTRWPADRWPTLARPMLMRGFTHVVFIGAPDERDQLRDVLPGDEVSGPIINLIGRTNLAEVMAVIAGAGLLVGNDAAPLHLAAGLGTPCVGLFGPTDPAVTGPCGKPLSALRLFAPKPGEIIDVDDPKLGDRLMRVISSAAVIQQIDRVLADAPKQPSIHTNSNTMRTATASSDGQTTKAIYRSPLFLASTSPRRKKMLKEAGIDVRVVPPDVDDGRLAPGGADPEEWVMALAYLKARRVVEMLHEKSERVGTVLGADTVCVHMGRVLGQPRDAEHAQRMLTEMRGRTHFTLTGVCLIDLATNKRRMFADRTEVRIGAIGDEELERYIASGEWRGKAGGYNLADRVAAGWPIEVTGDPTTVMGLPMARLAPVLPRAKGAHA